MRRVRRQAASTSAPFGWRPAAVLTAVNLVDGAESAVVIGALPLLQDEWSFSDAWAGAIATTAAIAGLFALLPAGWMADHLRRTRVLGLVLATWALLTTASAAAVAFWLFFLVRVLLGAAMHVDNPSASSLLADSYSPGLRGRVFGYQRVAFVVGTAIGIGIGGGVGDLLGWRAAFLVMVVPGLVVAWLCWRLPEPARGALDQVRDERADGVTAAESTAAHAALLEELELGPLDELEHGGGARAQLARVRDTLRIPTVRSLYLGLTVAFLGFNGIAFWLPTYFERTHDLSEGAAAGITAAAALIAGLGGSITGGILGDRRERRGLGGRIDIVVVSLGAGGLLLLAALAITPLALQVLLITAAAFVLSLSFPNFAAATADVLPARTRGTGFALFTFLLTLGGALGPFVVGAVSDVTDSLGLALAIAVLPTLPGAIVVTRARTTVARDAATARASLGVAQASGSEPTTPT